MARFKSVRLEVTVETNGRAHVHKILDAFEYQKLAVTTMGLAAGATSLGAFTGSTITDNGSVKDALQSLETAVEGKQPLDADLTTIAGLTESDSAFLVGTGAGWTTESGATARTSLGLGTGDSPTFTGITATGSISVSGTVDGRDIASDGSSLDNLNTTIGLGALTSAEVDQLENIGTSTISATQWGYLGASDQSLATTDSATFAAATINGNITVSGTVDGRDIASDGTSLDNLTTTIGLSALTSAEVDQLENIGTTTVSAAQWGYLGASDQGIATTDSPTFAAGTISGNLTVDTDTLFVDSTNNRVGVGTTSPSKTFEIIDTQAGTTVFDIRNDSLTGDGVSIRIGNITPLATQTFISFRGSDGNVDGTIKPNGSGAVAYNTTSDKRLKENIVDSVFSIDDLMRIPIREYNYIGINKSQTGFIAQELYEVIPSAVSVGGDDPNKDPWTVDYGKVTPHIIKSIQDLHSMLFGEDGEITKNNQMFSIMQGKWEEHERRIASLEEEVKVLKRESEAKITKLNEEVKLLKSYICSKDPGARFCK